MKDLGKEHRIAAWMPQGDIEAARAELKRLLPTPDEKRIVATALGLAVPAVREQSLEFARQHNFYVEYPQHVLAQCMK